MQVFIVTTLTGVWSVADSSELAELEAAEARLSEVDVKITECSVLQSKHLLERGGRGSMKEQIKEELESLKESETWLVPNADKYLQWCIDRIEQLEKALRVYADCVLCKEGVIAYPTGVEHSGVQEIGFDPCDCLIARQALGEEE